MVLNNFVTSYPSSGPLVVSMAIGANFLASIGLLNNSVMLGNLCSKLGGETCGPYEKPIVAFVCLSSGFLMLQVPPFHEFLITPPHPSYLVAVSLVNNPYPVLMALACQTVFLALWHRPTIQAPGTLTQNLSA
jgi:hypothetical protein